MTDQVAPYWSESVNARIQESSGGEFRPLRQMDTYALRRDTNPMLWMLKSIDQSEYYKNGFCLGLKRCSSTPNYDLHFGDIVFSPDLRLAIVNEGANRQHGKIRFTSKERFDAIDCWMLVKSKLRREIVIISRLRPLVATPPTERADPECPICKSEMAGDTLFTCSNGHQTHLTCMNNWTHNQTINLHCPICRCVIPRGGDIGKDYIETQFRLPAGTQRCADLLALSVFKKMFEKGATLLGVALGDTLFRYKTDHHITDWIPNSAEDPTMIGVIKNISCPDPYWRDFITFFRSAENIDYLYRVDPSRIKDYREEDFLRDLNAVEPVEVAMRLLTETSASHNLKDKLKWRIYIETQILPKTTEHLINHIAQSIEYGKTTLDHSDGFSRRSVDLPAVVDQCK